MLELVDNIPLGALDNRSNSVFSPNFSFLSLSIIRRRWSILQIKQVHFRFRQFSCLCIWWPEGTKSDLEEYLCLIKLDVETCLKNSSTSRSESSRPELFDKKWNWPLSSCVYMPITLKITFQPIRKCRCFNRSRFVGAMTHMYRPHV
jgi:hypothetical protein